MEPIFELALESIHNREYVIGNKTNNYILTVKNNNHHYLVVVLREHKIIDERQVHDRLIYAKHVGTQLLLDVAEDANERNTSMVHYKEDIPNGFPWQRDSDHVLKDIFAHATFDPFANVNYSLLNKLLRRFTEYRLMNEQHYLNHEKNYKVELYGYLGKILRRFPSEPAQAKTELTEFVGKRQSESKYVRWFDNLLSAMQGYAQREDLRAFLEYTDDNHVQQLFENLFEEGITVEVRTIFNDIYKRLFEEGKMSHSKTKYTPVTLHMLAVLLTSYDPGEYCLYKPTEYQIFAKYIGVPIENDIIQNYARYNRMVKLILEFAIKHKYKLEDLTDVHNMIYLYGQGHELFDKLADHEEADKVYGENTKNIIFYGPPGTGKTYRIVNQCLEILEPNLDRDLLDNQERRQELVQKFNAYVESNRIMTCTFHQSFGYEEFVEGIRYDEETQGYKIRDGVLKIIAQNASASLTRRQQSYHFDPDQINFFKMSLGNTQLGEEQFFDYCLEKGVVGINWGGDVDFTDCENKEAIRKAYNKKYPSQAIFNVDAVERLKHKIQMDDLIIVSHGNHKAKAIGRVKGPYFYDNNTDTGYCHFRKVDWLHISKDTPFPVERILKNKVFSQQSIYQLNPNDLNLDSIRDLISASDSGNPMQFILVIDEINRGNISKIFGELITLIEPDKRKGATNELSVILPYSQEKFFLPPNVHIVGTMNTADRSIALLDTALRRRFDFEEMMPDESILPEIVEGVNVRKLVKTINDRIEYLYDRDHTIGHAYFYTPQPCVKHYIQVMLRKVIPLLQEYFYENMEMVQLVLGGAGNGNRQDYFINQYTLTSSGLFNQTGSRWTEQDKVRYVVQPLPNMQALKNIYQSVETEDVSGE